MGLLSESLSISSGELQLPDRGHLFGAVPLMATLVESWVKGDINDG